MSRFNTAERVQLARDITTGNIPEWLITFWDNRFEGDTKRDAKKLLRSRTISYRTGCLIFNGFIGAAIVCAGVAMMVITSDIHFPRFSSAESRSVWIWISMLGFFLGGLLFSFGNSDKLLGKQYWSLDYIKRYWEELPLTKEEARRLADERVIALAVTVLQGQKRLTVDATDLVERERQMEILDQQREEEEERMGELSNTFDCFKYLGLVTIGKGGGYGGHFAQAKRRLAEASNDKA